MFSSPCRFAHETGDIESTRKDIAKELSFGAVGFAEPGRAFEVSSGLVGVAAFGITEPTDAQFPGRRIDLEVASQAYVIVLWQGTLTRTL